MNKLRLLTAIALLVFPLSSQGERGKPLNDPLLDKLVGDWNVERKLGSGRVAKNTVHVEWVLQHQFLELHYRDVATPAMYEALVLIGYDELAKDYVCHWMDNFGADGSAMGIAPRGAEGSNAIEFKFTPKTGDLTNRFAFDPKTGVWTSTIRQVENGEWKLFCVDTFTPASPK